MPCCKGSRHTREFSQLPGIKKNSEEPNSCKGREIAAIHLHQRYILKSSLGRKSERCLDPNETADKIIKHAFPDKIVVI